MQGPHLILELGQLGDLTVEVLGCCPILLKEPTLPLLEFLHSSLSPPSLFGLLGKLLLQILANSQGVLKGLFPGPSLGLGTVLEDPPRCRAKEGAELKNKRRSSG